MPKKRTRTVTELATGGEEKMNKIVDEVDRFFKNVHADVEDWKFSMEDYGDGTRIFVRFQIHFDKSGVSPSRERPKDPRPIPGQTPALPTALPNPGGRTLPDGREVTEDLHAPDGTGAARRADQDLASFVQQWRGKQDSNLGGEYHKEGAPYLDAQSEWKGHKRSSGEAAPPANGERSDEQSEGVRTSS
jgi:hypothetical protein